MGLVNLQCEKLMNQNLIYYPCFAMLLLSSIVLIKMFRQRVAAVKAGEIEIDYFKTYNFGNPTNKMLQADRNFTNLFEMPTLFYMLCIFAMASFKVTHFFLAAAWFYVLCRYLHSIVHITSNKIVPRMVLFTLSWLLLLIMGFKLAIDLWPIAN